MDFLVLFLGILIVGLSAIGFGGLGFLTGCNGDRTSRLLALVVVLLGGGGLGILMAIGTYVHPRNHDLTGVVIVFGSWVAGLIAGRLYALYKRG